MLFVVGACIGTGRAGRDDAADDLACGGSVQTKYDGVNGIGSNLCESGVFGDGTE